MIRSTILSVLLLLGNWSECFGGIRPMVGPHPEGISANSRWSSAANTTGLKSLKAPVSRRDSSRVRSPLSCNPCGIGWVRGPLSGGVAMLTTGYWLQSLRDEMPRNLSNGASHERVMVEGDHHLANAPESFGVVTWSSPERVSPAIMHFCRCRISLANAPQR